MFFSHHEFLWKNICHYSVCSHSSTLKQMSIDHHLSSLNIFSCSLRSFPISPIIFIFLLGTICNILMIATFCKKPTREMGTGIYRLWIAITGQLGLTVIVIHLTIDKHFDCRLLCFLFDYLGRAFHNFYDSLTACTALERTFLILQGLAFKKSSSRWVAKWIVAGLLVYHFLSIIHEPIYGHRHIYLNHSDCYPHLIGNYSKSISLLQFLLPYLLNLLLPILWIFKLTESKKKLNSNQSLLANLKKVLTSYKFTLISCYTLVLLNSPRFWSICMSFVNSNQQESIFILIAYWISLIPMVFSIFLFVLPSPKYRPELFGLIQNLLRYRNRMQYLAH